MSGKRRRADGRTAADAGRVIGGTARGVRLEAPGPGTRPLADRVKETLFAILEPDLPGANVLDLFAGSGAAGLEAMSRGAERVTFVERNPEANAVIARNLVRMRLNADLVWIVGADVIAWLGGADVRLAAPFDIVFVDPPYDRPNLLLAALEGVGPHVVPGGRVVAKHFWRDAPPGQVGLLASERERRFGETTLTFYRRTEDR